MNTHEIKIRHMVPAAAGFHVITPVQKSGRDGTVVDAGMDPVIAWAIDDIGVVYPVTVDTGLRDQGDPAILCPDGWVRSCEGSWPSPTAYLLDQASESLV